MKKPIKLSEGLILIVIGFLMFYSDYKLMEERYATPFNNFNLQTYVSSFLNDYHILLFSLFILLGLVKIGGVLIND